MKPIFDAGPRAGMAILYVICSLSMILVGLWAYRLPQLRQLEDDSDLEFRKSG